MKILHILKQPPDASIRNIIDIQTAGNQVTTVELFKGGVSYDLLVKHIFSHDKVFCW